MTICPMLAYLDPGSGSALIGTLFAVAGAFLYSAKSLILRIFFGKKSVSVKPNERIAIFSEGRNYWGTFKPIVEELLRRNVPFSYYTLDLHDPALCIDSPLMFARLYDRDKVTSFAKLKRIKSEVLLSTTPNIGCKGYPLDRPTQVKRLVHVFHDPVGGGNYYRKGGLDNYDEILTVGPKNEITIREIEQKRSLKRKVIVPVGTPYLDSYYERVQAEKTLACDSTKQKKTILVASTWGMKGVLRTFGYGFVKSLLDSGCHVIVRPHPHSYVFESDFIAKCKTEVCSWGAEWDDSVDGIKSMARSDLMISDNSGMRCDFAYLFLRPVISMKVEKRDVSDFEAEYLKFNLADRIGEYLGETLTDVADISAAVERLLAKGATGLEAFRNENCVNFGHAAKAVVDYLCKEAV